MMRDEYLLGLISLIAFVTGFVYVARRPTPYQGAILIRIFLGSPVVAAVVFIVILFCVGVFEGPPSPGTGILGVSVAACVYGLIAAMYGLPGAIIGGGLGAIVRKKSSD